MTEIVLPKLSYRIMEVLFTVHNKLGSGLLEKHYQKAIALELSKHKLLYEKERMVKLVYDGVSIGRYFLDFVIEDKVVLEIKATRLFGQGAFKQAYSYLKQLGLPLAIVVNFHSNRLKYKRIINSKSSDSVDKETELKI